MKNQISEIYNLLATDPKQAEETAFAFSQNSNEQVEKDELNWARAYALVELKRFDEARKIWADIFNRNKTHKALHQIGYVERSEGNLEKALEIYASERDLISSEDRTAVAANLYELTFCNFLLGNEKAALIYFSEYEQIEFDEPDLIERACFFRLKGDLLGNKVELARVAYNESIRLFLAADDKIGAQEIRSKLQGLNPTSF